MKTEAVRLYGVNDLRLETFELPEIKETEILARVVSDSICMSTYKAVIQGAKHKRVPDDVATNPTIMGHEFAGVIEQVGSAWAHQFKPGQKFAIQPALNYKGSPYAPGYSFPHFGGDATYIIIPNEVMELGFLLDYQGEGFYEASLSEPMSCIIGGFHANYHTETGKYIHHMGIKEGGKMALLAGAGPMGLGAIDYALNCDRRPGLLVVTDVNTIRLNRAKNLFPVEFAKERGVELVYVNPTEYENGNEYLLGLTEGTGYDDVFVYVPIKSLVEDADQLLGKDGCMNFFAGPTDTQFKAEVNFYNIHYTPTHIMGSTGGNADDMIESLQMSAKGLINPAVMVTHVGGLDSCAAAILDLPNIPGGKKLTYTAIKMPLICLEELLDVYSVEDLENVEKSTNKESLKYLQAVPGNAPIKQHFVELAEILRQNKGLWCATAEKYLLANF